MSYGTKCFCGMMLSLLLVLVLTIVLLATISFKAAWLMGNAGTLGVLFFWMLVALRHSRQRWSQPWYVRLGNILTLRS